MRSRLRSLSRAVRIIRLSVVHAVAGAWYRWRASLQVRVISSTLVVGVAALTLLGGYLSDAIRTGLFEQRVAQLLEESARSTQQAQTTFDDSIVSTGAEVSALFETLLPALQAGGTAERQVFLLRSPGVAPPIGVGDAVSDPELDSLVSARLRAAVQADDVQRWTSVAIPTSGAARAPGVVIGSLVNVPAAGQYELYYLYDLTPEQQTLSFVQRVLGLAALGLVLLLFAMTWLVTRQAVRPVRTAARVAERLADGHLTERMIVKGVDEMATLGRSFNEMAESLQDQIHRMEDMSHLQRRFVSDVSHELRTPLTTIRMAVEVIHAARRDLDPAASRSAELLYTQLDRFEELLADLLEISRFDAGAAMLDAESRDLRDIVAAALEQVGPLAERRGVWLSADLPPKAVIVDVDPRRLDRILRNLLVNAVEHGESRPVEIVMVADARAVALTVRDHGVGMSQDETEHVFDRFWRADPARARTTGGTGLGLAISIEDAHLHGGWLEAWGRPGLGACFRLTLPRRAGIALTSSPLPLEPVVLEHTPAVSYAAHEGRPALDPAGVPDFDRLEA